MVGFLLNIQDTKNVIHEWLKEKIIRYKRVQLGNKAGCKNIELESTGKLNREATSLLKRIYFCTAASFSCFLMVALFFFWNVGSFYQTLFYLLGNVFLFCTHRYFLSGVLTDENVEAFISKLTSPLGRCWFFIKDTSIGLFLQGLLCLILLVIWPFSRIIQDRLFSILFEAPVVNSFHAVELAYSAVNGTALSWFNLLMYPLLYNMAFLVFNISSIVGALGFCDDYNKTFKRFSPVSLCCILPTLALFFSQLYIDPIFLSFTVFVSIVGLFGDLALCMAFEDSMGKKRHKDMDVSKDKAGFDGQSLNSRDLKPKRRAGECGSVRDQGHASKQDQQFWDNVKSFFGA